MRYSAWLETWHTQDMQDRVQALPKVQLSISGPQRSSHWFPLLTYSSIDTVTLCQSSLTQWILDALRSLSVSTAKYFFFFFFWSLWRFSAPNSIGALPSFRLGLHFSALICILREGSHWKRSRQSMCGRCWSAARKTLSIPLKVGPDVCHYLYW